MIPPASVGDASGAADDDARDRAAFARVAAGDRAALGEVVQRHQAAVFRFARRMLHDDAAAEDVLQETFVAALRRAGDFRGEGTVRGWLLAVARNAARMRQRRRVGEPSVHEPLDVLDEPASIEACAALGEAAGFGADPERALAAAEQSAARRVWLSGALEALPWGEREVLWLRDVEGLSGDDAAAALGLSRAAMKSRLHRARLHLLAELRARAPDAAGGAAGGPAGDEGGRDEGRA
jgi:RNA polymerase sigma-70 factor (ECF subfamily)